MTTERKEQIRLSLVPLLEDEAFLKALLTAEEPEKMSEVLGAYGVSVTSDEVDELMQEGIDGMLEMQEKVSDELNEEQLENVAGGGILKGIVVGLLAVGGAVAIGAGLGVLAGAGVIAVGTCYSIGVGYSVVSGAGVISALKSKKKKKK